MFVKVSYNRLYNTCKYGLVLPVRTCAPNVTGPGPEQGLDQCFLGGPGPGPLPGPGPVQSGRAVLGLDLTALFVIGRVPALNHSLVPLHPPHP